MQKVRLAPVELSDEQRAKMVETLQRTMCEEAREARLAAGLVEAPAVQTAPQVDRAEVAARRWRALEPFALPNGSVVWVGTCSNADKRDLLRSTAHIEPPVIRPTDPQHVIAALRDAYFQALRPYQVALCSYKSEERRPDNLRWVTPDLLPDGAAVEEELPSLVIDAICAKSDSIAALPADETERLRGFFDWCLEVLSRWSTASSTGSPCPPGLEEETKELIELCGRARSLGKLPSDGAASLSGT